MMSSDKRPPPTGMPPPTMAPTRAPPAMAATKAPFAKPATAAPTQPVAAAEVAPMLPTDPAPPAPILHAEQNVAQWPGTPGYRGFLAWLRRRCARIRGQPIRRGVDGVTEQPVLELMALLDALVAWVAEAPPQPQARQRFGNLAFRGYIALVEDRLPALLDWLPARTRGQVLPLLLASHAFGHKTRLDYGTGHELAFALALYCVSLGMAMDGAGEERVDAVADDLVLRVFPRYLELTTLLQTTYRLEPAGSHGVWGLDDYCFLPYLFGSAQVLGADVTPAHALAEATRAGVAADEYEDMYTLALHRVGYFKKGARFSEHSPLLHSLAQFPSWVKVHGGLLKMFQAEVLGKRVVVQSLWVGGWLWGNPLPRAEREEDAPASPFAAAPNAASPFPPSPAPGRTTTTTRPR